MQSMREAAGRADVVGRARDLQQTAALAKKERPRIERLEGRSVDRTEVHPRIDADVDVEAERFDRGRRGRAETVPSRLEYRRRVPEVRRNGRAQQANLVELDIRAEVAPETVSVRQLLDYRRVHPWMTMGAYVAS